MDYSEIVGNQHIKSHLLNTVQTGRLAHAQLFTGSMGSGILPAAIAYAAEILCLQYKKDSPEYKNTKKRARQLIHPDLHFVFPVATTDKVKDKPVSDDFIHEWREFVLKNPYTSLFQWLTSLGIERKQGNISRYEADRIAQKLALKPFEGGYKVMIIWMAENMNSTCANRILKLIEEPADKTVLLLLAENENKILSTILSRCQKLNFPLLSENAISEGLMRDFKISQTEASHLAIAARGSYNRAIQLLENSEETKEFEKWFVDLVRTAFSARGNKKSILSLLDWADEVAAKNRETQKQFIGYCTETFRQAFLQNYQMEELVYFKSHDPGFQLSRFAPFIHHNNIFEIRDILEKAYYGIERNVNGKVIFTDLSIKLTRLIHRKE